MERERTVKNRLLNFFCNYYYMLLYVGIAICTFVFSITLIRSIITGITYDEAYTYLFIARQNLLDVSVIKSYFSGENCIANNHWLNTYLILFFDRLFDEPYNEFLIRFPSLVSFVFYLITVCVGYKKKLYSFATFTLLTCNYYLNEFYGLARGYGMANLFVFIMCLSYSAWRRSEYSKMVYVNILILAAAMACFSNTIVLMLYPAIGCMCLFHILKEGETRRFLKKCGIPVILFSICTVIQFIYHLNISQEGKPLYTGAQAGFFECFVKGYVYMFVKDPFATVMSVLIIFLCLVCVALLRVRILKLDFVLMLAMFVLTNVITQVFFQKGYATGRVLLSYYSFIIIALSELFGNAIKQFHLKSTTKMNYASFAFCVCMCLLYVTKLNIHCTEEWKTDYAHKKLETGKYLTGIDYHDGEPTPDQIFYEKKYDEIIKEYEQHNIEEY